MAKKRTFTIAKRHIINQGKPDEHIYDDIGKSGVITSNNQVVFPFSFIGEHLLLRGSHDIVANLVRFVDRDTKKYGLARWPSGEIVFQPQWDTVELLCGFYGDYCLCGKYAPNEFRSLPNYRWNIVNEGKLLLDDYYLGFSEYRPSHDYNVAVVSCREFNRILGYSNCCIEVFYRDGTVVYHGECYQIRRLNRYSNVFIVNNPDGHGFNTNNYAIHIYYMDELGRHRLFSKSVEYGNIYWEIGEFRDIDDDMKAKVYRPQ
ncbi:hypothetical protein IKG54_00810 [Candidatus Saccharibacteria bacterium]|nr:hypothetical protein [Candidatus Saccharibacteria bacterium]